MNMNDLLPGLPTIFPFYHTVSDKKLAHIRHLYHYRSVREFEQELDFFLKHYEPVEPGQLIKEGTISGKKQFLLTFDDGFAEIYHVIAPLLTKKGIPAIFFLNTGFIDNKDLFYRCKASILAEYADAGRLAKAGKYQSPQKTDAIEPPEKQDIHETFRKLDTPEKQDMHETFRKLDTPEKKDIHETFRRLDTPEKVKRFVLGISWNDQHWLDEMAASLEIDFQEYLKKHQPYLTAAQIKELLKKGFHVGAHSVSHADFRAIPFTEQWNQIITSLDEIRERFQVDYRYFSFPFTDHGMSGKLLEQLHDPQENGCDLSFGCAGMKTDSSPFHFQRIPMEDYRLSARHIIFIERLSYLLKKPLGKHRVVRRGY